MANFVYNISKGKVAELSQRVEANDPAASVLVLEAINSTATDAVLMDLDTFAQIEADANTAQVTNSGYARKTFPNGTVTITIDDTNDRMDVDVADQTWTAVVAGTAWTDLVFGYDPSSTGVTDSVIVPLTQHDFTVTPDGSDITATIAVFFRAS